MSYWTFTDIFEEAGVGPTPFHGGFGLFNIQSLKKPSYFAYRFLSRMGDTELYCADPESWACKGDRGVQVLFWSYRLPQQDAPDRPFFTRDLPSRPEEPVRLRIEGLKPGTYRYSVSKTGYRNNDVYTEYLLRGYTDLADRRESEQLRCMAGGVPEVVSRFTVGEDGVFTLDLPQRLYDCQLVELEQSDGDALC